MAQRGLDIVVRKNFQGMEFRDFYELAAKVKNMHNYSDKEINGESPPWELTDRR